LTNARCGSHGAMNEEAHLLNSSVLQVRPTHGEVLESTHNTLIVRAVSHREECAVRGRELGMSVAGVAVE
jgi:hypothetical protein